MRKNFKKLLSLTLIMTLLFATTTFTAYAADDVTGLITNKSISVVQNENVIGEGDTISSLDPITISISFEAPLIGDNESDHVLYGDTATFPVAEGFSLIIPDSDPGIYNDMPLVYDGIVIGHISLIEDPAGTINASVVFDGESQVFDGSQGWSELQCSFSSILEYNYDVGGGSIENHTVILLGKEVTVNVPENSVTAEVEKSGIRDGKFIDWVVEAEASQGNGNFDLEDFMFSDNLSNVGSYVEGTFKAGTTANVAEAILPTDNFATTTNGIEYTFPENSMGKRFLFFRTEIKDDVFYSNGNKTVTNTATVKKGSIVGTGTGQVTFTSVWITKALDGTFNPTNRNISWNIEANHLGASLNSAVITDALDAKLDFVSASWQEWDKINNVWGAVTAITPTGNDFELGDIDSKVRLNIRAKVKSEYNTEHEIQGISNTATLSWQDSTVIGSNTVNSNIGFNPIVKKYVANSVDYTNHTMDWEVTVKASDENDHLRVLDILVYGGSTLNLNTIDELAIDSGKNRLTQITKAELVGITQNRNLKYADGFNGYGNLEVTVHKLIDTVSGKPVADVLVVTAVGGTQIDVASGDKTFKFKTQITEPSIYAVNVDTYINNRAFLMKTVIDSITNTVESNEIINRGSARVLYESRMLAKDILNISNTDLIEPNKNSVGTGADKDKGFDYKDGTAVFRLHVNANGITDITGDITPTDGAELGNVVVTDTLPEGWEFVEIETGKDFLLYEGSNGDDQGRLVAGDIVENPSFVTGDFSVGGKATFTFTTVNKPYIIYVKAKVTDEKYEEYFRINQTYNDENTVVLSATGYDNLNTQKQKVLIRSSVLSKEASLVQAGEVKWTVLYNPYTIAHGAVEILDVLPVGIDIKIDSSGNLDLTDDNIKVTQYDTLNADGTLAGPSQIVLTEDVNIFYDNETRELKFRIPDSSKAYEFVYKTDVTGSPGSSLSNSVKLVGYDYDSPGNNAQYQVSAADTSATMRKSGWIEITKSGSNNEVKEGAEFKIVTLDRATTIRTGITNSSGKLFLRGLPVGDYLLIETVAPVGHSISPIAYEVSVIQDGNDIVTSIDGKTGEGQNTISVKNTLDGAAGNLTVGKVLEGNATDVNKDFEFTLEIAGLNGEYSYEGSGGKTNGSILFTAGSANFTLRGGESIKIVGIATDSVYKITETDYSAEGYITSVVGEDDKIIVADDTKVETFTNTRNTGELVVTKSLDGNATDPNKDFEFTLAIPELNGEFNYIGLGGKADGSITFTAGIANFTLKGGESIKITTFLDGLEYSVTEDDYSAEGYITSMVGEAIKFITKDITKTEAFTNTRNTGELVVTKSLDGNATDPNKDFEFTLAIPDLNGDFNYEGLGGRADGSITFIAGIASFTLKGGESIKITTFLDGLEYSVTETDYSAEGYITSVVGEDIKFITKDITKTEAFTNSRNTGELVIEKVLKGNETDANKEFEFSLEIPGLNGEYNYEGSGGKANGALEFSEGVANFTLKGGESIKILEILDGLEYTVTESDYSEEGYITNLVGEDEKLIKADAAKVETFVNSRNTGVLVIKKVLEGNATDAKKDFDFTLEIPELNGEYNYEGLGGKANGTITFTEGKTNFVLKGGESIKIVSILDGLEYKVTEADYSKDGYDTLKDGDKGKIDVEEVQIATFTNKKNLIVESPKTGDEENILHWLYITVAGLIAIAVLSLITRKIS